MHGQPVSGNGLGVEMRGAPPATRISTSFRSS